MLEDWVVEDRDRTSPQTPSLVVRRIDRASGIPRVGGLEVERPGEGAAALSAGARTEGRGDASTTEPSCRCRHRRGVVPFPDGGGAATTPTPPARPPAQAEEQTQEPAAHEGTQGVDVANVLEDPAAYDGKRVAVDSRVVDLISGDAFTIVAGDIPGREPLLVVHDGSYQPESGTQVRTAGVVNEALDVETVAGRLNDDVADALENDWDKEPYLDATQGEVQSLKP